MMKRFMVLIVGLVFLFCTSAIAAPATAAKADPAKTKTAEKKAAKMSTAGKVLAVSDKVLKIERTLKGKAETMEFSLEKSITGIKVGDQVKVSYLVKDGQNILIRVAPAKKKAKKKANTPAPAPAKK